MGEHVAANVVAPRTTWNRRTRRRIVLLAVSIPRAAGRGCLDPRGSTWGVLPRVGSGVGVVGDEVGGAEQGGRLVVAEGEGGAVVVDRR